MVPLSAFHVRFVPCDDIIGTMWPSIIQCSVIKQRVKVVMCSCVPLQSVRRQGGGYRDGAAGDR